MSQWRWTARNRGMAVQIPPCLYAQAALLVGRWWAVCERGENKRKGETSALFPSLPRQQVFSVGGPALYSLWLPDSRHSIFLNHNQLTIYRIWTDPRLSLSLQPSCLSLTKIVFVPSVLSWISLACLGLLAYLVRLFSISFALLWPFSVFEPVRLCLIQRLKYSHLSINTKHIISFSYHFQKRLTLQLKRHTFRKTASLLHSALWRTQLSENPPPWGSQPHPRSPTKWVGYKLQWPFKIPQGHALGHLTVIDYGFCSQLRIF